MDEQVNGSGGGGDGSSNRSNSISSDDGRAAGGSNGSRIVVFSSPLYAPHVLRAPRRVPRRVSRIAAPAAPAAAASQSQDRVGTCRNMPPTNGVAAVPRWFSPNWWSRQWLSRTITKTTAATAASANVTDWPLWFPLQDQLSASHKTEILRGGYCLVPDRGVLASLLHEYPEVVRVLSSHKSIDGHSGSILLENDKNGVLIFGRIATPPSVRTKLKELSTVQDGEQQAIAMTTHENVDICTWFQMERYTLLKKPALHAWTWVQYAVLSENVGPDGRSRFTEKHPLLLMIDQSQYA